MFTKEQVDVIKQLEKKYPNNMEYGSAVRSLYMNEDFTRSIPNDIELGEQLRRIIKNF